MIVIAIGTSAAMGWSISSKTDVQCNDIARLLAAMASYICEDAIVYTFDTSIKKIVFSSKAGIITKAMSIPNLGGGTNLRLPLLAMLQHNIRADRLIMISDNEINSGWQGFSQTCQPLADQYRAKINKAFWAHAIDLM